MFGKNGLRVLLIATSMFLSASGPSHYAIVSTDNQNELRARYYVISNLIVNKGNRDIYILLEKQYFMEGYLRTLMGELFEKFPEPNNLHVTLYSNIEQVRGFVDGHPHHGTELVLDMNDPGRYNRYEHGLLFREGDNQVIRYHLPDYKDESLITIVVKGSDR